jgi:hypothetical protein
LQQAAFPRDPIYLTADRRSPFFVPTSSGSYEAIGLLPKGTVVILRAKERSWADIQLMSGHLGSVFADSLRFLSPEEAADLPLHSSPDSLEPLPRTTAGGSDSVIDPALWSAR